MAISHDYSRQFRVARLNFDPFPIRRSVSPVSHKVLCSTGSYSTRDKVGTGIPVENGIRKCSILIFNDRLREKEKGAKKWNIDDGNGCVDDLCVRRRYERGTKKLMCKVGRFKPQLTCALFFRLNTTLLFKTSNAGQSRTTVLIDRRDEQRDIVRGTDARHVTRV